MCQVPAENHCRAGTSARFLSASASSLSVRTHRCSVFTQIENSYSLSVPIFKQFHKNIIGKGGANIKKVKLSTLNYKNAKSSKLNATARFVSLDPGGDQHQDRPANREQQL